MEKYNKKGISLIVLVITIIVMIILAAAIILSISNSGIMDKANQAKTDSDTANLKEYVNVLEAEWELMDTSERNATGKSSKTEYVNAKLQEKGYISALLMNDGTLYTNLQENTKKALQAGLQIGDTVTGYTVKSNSYTTDGSENVFKASVDSNGLNYWENVNQPQTITSDTSITNWVYMGISKDGKLQMTTVSPVNEITISGSGGYLNGANALNTICEKLYSTSKGTARSMNIDDVNNLLEYTSIKGTFECVHNDGRPRDVIELNDALTVKEIKEKYSFDLNPSHYSPTGPSCDGYIVDYYTISKNSSNITSNEVIKALVFNNGNYWLASNCFEGCFNDYGGYCSSYFNMRYVTSNDVNSCHLTSTSFNEGGFTYSDGGSYSKKIKPVVQLNSDVSLSYSNGVLTIN